MPQSCFNCFRGDEDDEDEDIVGYNRLTSGDDITWSDSIAGSETDLADGPDSGHAHQHGNQDDDAEYTEVDQKAKRLSSKLKRREVSERMYVW